MRWRGWLVLLACPVVASCATARPVAVETGGLGWVIWEMNLHGRNGKTYFPMERAVTMAACVERLEQVVLPHSPGDNPVGPMVWNVSPPRVAGGPPLFRACFPAEYNPKPKES